MYKVKQIQFIISIKKLTEEHTLQSNQFSFPTL